MLAGRSSFWNHARCVAGLCQKHVPLAVLATHFAPNVLSIYVQGRFGPLWHSAQNGSSKFEKMTMKTEGNEEALATRKWPLNVHFAVLSTVAAGNFTMCLSVS